MPAGGPPSTGSTIDAGGRLSGIACGRLNCQAAIGTVKNTLNVFIISTQTVPPITLLIPYFGMVVSFGIFNTYFALILTYMIFTERYFLAGMTYGSVKSQEPRAPQLSAA